MGEFTYNAQFAESPGNGYVAVAFWSVGIVLVLVIAIGFLKRAIDRKKERLIFLRSRDVPGIIRNLSGFDFEVWTKELLLSLGVKAHVTPNERDHGIDVIAEYKGKKIGIQCKKYYGDRLVGEPIVRDLYGVKHADGYYKVMLVTTGNFSYPAQAWAVGKKDLVLVNAKLLERVILNRKLMLELME